jgi:Domain of unknown function (DUF4338)
VCVRSGGALILQPHIRHAGDAGTARARFAKLLSYVAILPWVRVADLASHILGRIARRINADWQKRYHHGIHLLETFVQPDRFRGTCYRAANWIRVGQTTGRTRQSRRQRDNLVHAPCKDIYLYPLTSDVQRQLCG